MSTLERVQKFLLAIKSTLSMDMYICILWIQMHCVLWIQVYMSNIVATNVLYVLRYSAYQ